MRRLEYLINEARRSTDNTDTNGVKDAEIIEYFNDGVRYIQNIVFKANPKADIFKGSITYEPSSDGVYDLPSDIFAVNAISLVLVQDLPLDRIDESNKGSMCGYWIEDGKLNLTGSRHIYPVTVKYFKALPRLDKRWGKIASLISGTSLTLEAGYDDLASTVDDYITVVSKEGDAVLEGVFVDNYNAAIWETSNALTGVAVGDYVCMGQRSANKISLPEACKTYLMDYVRQRLYTRNNYSDSNKQVYFTDKQEADLVGLFSNNTKEFLTPPITDYTFMEF